MSNKRLETIYDKRSSIGGTLNEARLAPCGDDVVSGPARNIQETMCKKWGVEIKLSTEVTEERYRLTKIFFWPSALSHGEGSSPHKERRKE